MPQQYSGFTPDPQPNYSGFTPDPPQQTPKQPATQPSWYENLWDTAADYIPMPVKQAWNYANEPLAEFGPMATSAAMRALPGFNLFADNPHAVGALEGFSEGATTPLNLAAMGSTGGASLLARSALNAPKLVSGAVNLARGADALAAGHGAQTIANPRTSLGEKAMGGIELVGGGLGAAFPPVFKPKVATPDSLPVRQSAAPIDTPIPRGWDINEMRGASMQGEPAGLGKWDIDEGGQPFHVVDQASVPDLPVKPNEILNPPDLTSPVERLSNEELTRLSGLSEALGGTGKRAGEAQIELMRRGIGSGVPHVNDPTFYNANTGELIDYNFKEGTRRATRLEESSPIPEFDPSTLQGLEPTAPSSGAMQWTGNRRGPGTGTPELQFVDPTTGEIRPASKAKPGDVPLPSDVAPPAKTQPATLSDWMKELVRDESGEFDPDELVNRIARWRAGNSSARNLPEPELSSSAFTPESGPRTTYTPDSPTPFLDDYWRTVAPEAKGLSLDELEATKKRPALERLGKLIGEDRAEILKSGEKPIKFDQEPHRRPGQKAKKLSPSTIQTWSKWGDEAVEQNVRPDPSKPGLTVDESSSEYYPKAFKIEYRDANGRPIGELQTDLTGRGISSLAVRSDLGLRRGKVAFEMLKQAFDRGVSEPSGATSDLTKNLIARIKRLIKDDSGEFDPETLYRNINKLIDEFSNSKLGKGVGRFFSEDSGELDLGRLAEIKTKISSSAEHVKDAAMMPFRRLKRMGQLIDKDLEGLPNDEWKVKFAKTIGEQVSDELRDQAKWANKQNFEFPEQTAAIREVASHLTKMADELDAIPPTPEKLTVLTTIRRFFTEDSGELDLGRLQALFEKNKTGALTATELAEAKQLAKQAQSAPTQTPRQYLEGQSQVDTGPIDPANVRPAAAVVESLQQRLQKAIDNEGTPNAVAPQEISQLLDEAAEVLARDPGASDAGPIRQILGANKALLTSWDMSAPGRQGKAFILNKAWWTSIDDMAKAWGSKEAANLVNQSIIDHPSGYFKRGVTETGKSTPSFAEKMGLDLASTEEMFKNTIGKGFEKYSGVGKAGRAHTAFLNKLRSDQFVSMIEASKKAGKNPEVDTQIAKAYAKFINDATGRGSVNIGKWKLERNIGVLNDVFFAPKNMSGQIRTWNAVLNPVKYINYDPVLRKQALKSLFAIAGLGGGVGQIANLASDSVSVSNDPTSADFRKIRIGDLRIDMFGGYQQFPVAAMKLMLGRSTPTTGENEGKPQDLDSGKFGRQTRGTVAERFFTNRLSPAGSFIYAWMNNAEFDGKPFEYKRALYERVFPIAAKDIWELAQEDPVLAAALGPATLSGLIGTQHYSGR